MAKSISQAQASALAAGFLNGIGSNPDDFVAASTVSKLFEIAGGLIENAADNLNKKDRTASGALESSMRIANPNVQADRASVDISLLYYYKFVDKGVMGTKKSYQSSPYSFKNDIVSLKMYRNIYRWLRKEGLKGKTNVSGKTITKRESRRKKITNPIASAVYAISKSVKMKGLKKSNFFTDAVKNTSAVMQREFSASLNADIIETLKPFKS